MTGSFVVLSVLLLASSAFADDDSSRAQLMAQWQQTDGGGENKPTWTFEGSGDSIHVVKSIGAQTLAEFECNTQGKECAVKDAGRRAKVSLWFNGPKLIEMETVGSDVVKRSFSTAADGDTMDLETIPIAPAGATETTHFKRVPSAAAKQ